MKKIMLTWCFALMVTTAFAQSVFKEKEKFGLTVAGRVVLKAKYEAIKMDYSNARPDNEDFVAVKQKGKWGFFDFKGKEIIPIKYEDYIHTKFFKGGLICVKQNGKWGFINMQGTEKIPFKYDDSKGFYPYNGFTGNAEYAAVKSNDQWGFVDKTGNEVIPFEYEDAMPFGQKGACIKLDGKWGMINKAGEILTPAKFDEPFNFDFGTAYVKQNGRSFKIYDNGQEVGGETPTNNPSNNNTPSNNNNTPKKQFNWSCSKCSQSKVADSKPSDGGCRYMDSGGKMANGRHNWTKK